MAKVSPVSTKPAQTKNVPATTKDTNAPPAHLRDRMAADSGKGVSQAQEDNLVPLIYILQPLSPQVNKRNPAYIEGAEPGAIWLRNAQKPIIPGEDGMWFQPCYFSKDWVEWVPRDSGGGFVARHTDLPEDAETVTDPKNPNRKRYIRPNGNEVIETRYHIGIAITRNGRMPYVIPLSSTGHNFSRELMFRMNNAIIESGKRAASYAKIYHLQTKERTNASGTWFTWSIVDDRWVQDEKEYTEGSNLHDAFASGAKAVDQVDEEHVSSTPSEEM